MTTERSPARTESLWGPNPNPAMASIEEGFYQVGFNFLARLYGAALGLPAPRQLHKTLGGPLEGRPPGWGDLARLFQAGGSPEDLVARWGAIVDRLVDHLLPARTQAEAAQRLAIQAHLLGRVRARVEVEEGGGGSSWEEVAGRMSPIAQEAMAWSRQRSMEALRGLEEGARRRVMSVFIQSREAGESVQGLQQRLFEACSAQNRDWRRVALTETATAVANGTLAAVDPSEGWEAEWVAAPTACPSCRRWHGQRFRVVSPDAPEKNGLREVWAGKSNVGRSANPRTRSGRPRETSELWWPAQPCHPCCRCQWVLRRAQGSLTG